MKKKIWLASERIPGKKFLGIRENWESRNMKRRVEKISVGQKTRNFQRVH